MFYLVSQRCFLCGRNLKTNVTRLRLQRPIHVLSGVKFIPDNGFQDRPSLQLSAGTIPKRQSFLPTRQLITTDVIRNLSTEPTTFYEQLLASKPIHSVQAFLENFHDLTGASWSATIIFAAISLRLFLTFPVALFSEFNSVKVEKLKPMILARAKYSFFTRYAYRMKFERWSKKRVDSLFLRTIKQESKKMYIEKNCHPGKSFVIFLMQIPIFIMMSMALRNMTGAFAERIYMDPALMISVMSTESFLWLPNLVSPDPFFILPVMLGVTNLVNIEFKLLRAEAVVGKRRIITNFFRGLSIVMIPLASLMPSAISLYWTTSAFSALLQNIFLAMPSVRRGLGIPRTESSSDTPFQDMKRRFSERYLRRFDSDKSPSSLYKLDKFVENQDKTDKKDENSMKR